MEGVQITIGSLNTVFQLYSQCKPNLLMNFIFKLRMIQNYSSGG